MKGYRQQEIVRMLQKEKIINTANLAEHFSVSIETIRRDLDQLEKQGILNKTYGGAELKPQTNVMPSPLESRRSTAADAKAAIAAYAAKYIKGPCTIALDAGSTIYELCPFLNELNQLIIVCNDIHTAAKLLEGGQNKVYLMGGFLTHDGTSNGTFAKEFFNSVAGIDVFICSADGAHPEEGLSSDESGINDLKKRYIRSAHKKIALLDHTKFQRKGFYKTCNFTDMDLLITDSKTPADIIDKIRRGGTPVEAVEI